MIPTNDRNGVAQQLDDLLKYLSNKYSTHLNSNEEILRLRDAVSDAKDIDFDNQVGFSLASLNRAGFHPSDEDILLTHQRFQQWCNDLDILLFERVANLKDLEARGLMSLIHLAPRVCTISELPGIFWSSGTFEQQLILGQLIDRGYLPKFGTIRIDYSREIRAALDLKWSFQKKEDANFVIDNLIHFPNRDLLYRACETIPSERFISGIRQNLFEGRSTAHEILEFTYMVLENYGPDQVSRYQRIHRMPKFDASRLPSVKKMTDLLYDVGKLPTDLGKLVCSYLWEGSAALL